MVRCIVLSKQIWVYTYRVGIAFLDRAGLHPVERNGEWYLPCVLLGTGEDGGFRVRLPNGLKIEVERENLILPRRAA